MEDINSIYAGNELFSEKTLKSPDPLLCSTPNRQANNSCKSVYIFVIPCKLLLFLVFFFCNVFNHFTFSLSKKVNYILHAIIFLIKL